MASVTAESKNGRTSYRITWQDGNKRRRRIRVGGICKKDAAEIATKVQAIVGCQISGRPLDTSTMLWLTGVGDDLHQKLAEAGLVEPRMAATLDAFLAQFIDNKREELAPSTICNFEQMRRSLVDFLGPNRDLRSITEGDADAWQASLGRRSEIRRAYSPATASKLIKRAKQVFRSAVRSKLCDVNPFADLKAGGEENPERKRFVGRDVIEAAIAAAPSTEWKLIIALARYAGLRMPSEALALRWADIDWDAGVMRITSPKTKRYGKGFRIVPIFPELKGWLESSFEEAEVGTEFVIRRYRQANANLRTQFERILVKANVSPWPRLFHNLRASRETELANEYPLHVVTEWLGNTPKVASRHYLTVTPEHVAQANGSLLGGAKGGAVTGRNELKRAPPVAPPALKNPEKHAVSRGLTSSKAPRTEPSSLKYSLSAAT